jgi:hypothetical protein
MKMNLLLSSAVLALSINFVAAESEAPFSTSDSVNSTYAEAPQVSALEKEYRGNLERQSKEEDCFNVDNFYEKYHQKQHEATVVQAAGGVVKNEIREYLEWVKLLDTKARSLKKHASETSNLLVLAHGMERKDHLMIEMELLGASSLVDKTFTDADKAFLEKEAAKKLEGVDVNDLKLQEDVRLLTIVKLVKDSSEKLQEIVDLAQQRNPEHFESVQTLANAMYTLARAELDRSVKPSLIRKKVAEIDKVVEDAVSNPAVEEAQAVEVAEVAVSNSTLEEAEVVVVASPTVEEAQAVEVVEKVSTEETVSNNS